MYTPPLSRSRKILLALTCLFGGVLISYQNCSPVKFSSLTATSQKSEVEVCHVNESIACDVQHGQGRQTCSIEGHWGTCESVVCDPGYSFSGGTCVIAACPFPPNGENACSDKSIVGYGTCGEKDLGTKSCTPTFCRKENRSAPVNADCKDECVNDSKCNEKNGSGRKSCDGIPRCVLQDCEQGFQFDKDLNACVSISCSGNQTLDCDTEWGSGTRRCTNEHYDVICEPKECPTLHELQTMNGYRICVPILCKPGQHRVSGGVSGGACEDDSYTWKTSAFGACSAECEGGTQSRDIACEKYDGTKVDDKFCKQPKPSKTQSCNPQACPVYDWLASDYGKCSAECDGGTQTRTVKCQSDGGKPAEDTLCKNQKPPASRACNVEPCLTYSWETSDYGVCSAECDGGKQTRTVKCKRSDGQFVVDELCKDAKPSIERACNTQACPIYEWKTYDYGDCSAECGGGTQTRPVKCKRDDGQDATEKLCKEPKPVTSRACNTQECYSYAWKTSDYGTCSATCGPGSQSRTVACERSDKKTVGDSFCTGAKPNETQVCEIATCQTEPSGDWHCGYYLPNDRWTVCDGNDLRQFFIQGCQDYICSRLGAPYGEPVGPRY